MEATRGILRRVERLEQHRPESRPVFTIHGRRGPDGRCADCDLGDEAHFTISIDRATGRLEHRHVGVDLEAV